MVLEFYQKNIINQHFFSRKFRKAIRKQIRMFETRDLCEENMQKNQIVTKSMFFAYKTKDIDCMEKNLI